MSDQFQNFNLEIIKADTADTFSATLKDDNGKTLASDSFKYKIDLHILSTIEDSIARDAVKGANLIRAFGKGLFNTALSGQISGYYKAAIGSRKDIRLQLLFKADESALQRIPWEFLYDGNNFLAAYPRVQLTRGIIGISGDHQEKISGKIKVLAIVSSPLDLKDHERLQSEEEQLKIMQALDRANAAQQVDLDFLDEASLRNIRAKLDEDQYHIIHYTGHGVYSEKEDRGYLILEDDQGKSERVDNKTVATLFAGHKSLRLVVLSGCQTAKTSGRQAFSDLATPLLQQNIPAVVALQYSITDQSGIDLATRLYTEIANRAPVDVALTRARRELLVGGGNGVVEFATPLLYTTNPDCLETVMELPKVTGIGFKLDREIKLETNVSLGIERLGNQFIGRRKQLRRIKEDFLQRGIRVVVVHGIGGVGKTVIASRTAEKLLEHFAGVYAFDCRSGLTPEKVLLELHEFLKRNGINVLEQVLKADAPIETKIDSLGQVLNQIKLLIIFDNFETLLPEEHDRAEIDGRELKAALKTLVNHCSDGSRFLFTSRYTFNLTDGRMTNLIDEINLGELSRPEAIMVMNRIPEIATTDFATKLEIFNKIGGHPYTINMLGVHAHQTSVKDVLNDLSSVTKEMVEFTLLDRSYERLMPEERDLLFTLAVLKKAISFSGVQYLAKQGRNADETEKLITKLIHWGLLIRLEDDEDRALYQVHTLVKQYVKSRTDVNDWRKRLVAAARYYEERLDSTLSLWDHLDARDLYFDAAEFERAASIVAGATRYLRWWGFLELAQRLNEETAATVGGLAKAAALHNLAVLDQARGNYEGALQKYQASLDIAEQLDDQLGISRTLHQVGNLHYLRGDFGKALEVYSRSMALARSLGAKAEIGNALHQIAMIHQAQGDYDKALVNYQESLSIAEELMDKPGIAATLHQLGSLYYLRGDPAKALEKYSESLTIASELGNKGGIAETLHQLAIIHQDKGQFDEALDKYSQSLQIKRELGDKGGIAATLHQLGMIYQARGDFDVALEQYEESLRLKNELGDKIRAARTLHQMGTIYQERLDYDRALRAYAESLQIAQSQGDKLSMASTYAVLGRTYEALSDIKKAIENYVTAYALLDQMKSPYVREVYADLVRLKDRIGGEAFEKSFVEVTQTLQQVIEIKPALF